MKILQLNPNSCLTYLLSNGGNKVTIIDPVIEHVKDYIKQLDQENLELEAIIDTHSHADHISGGPSLKDLTGADYLMHRNSPSQCVSQRLNDGESLKIGGAKAIVMYTPGHTQDSISLVFNEAVLTGDALFLDDGGAGRDDLPGGNSGDHFDSLQRLKGLPSSTIVYPSHDYRRRKPSNIKRQISTNPFLKIKSKTEYVEFLTELKLGPADWMADVLEANYSCARDPNAAWTPVDSNSCEVKGTMVGNSNECQVETLEPNEVNALDSSTTLLDVREPEELNGELGHIHGVLNIPVGSLATRLKELEPFKDKTIITICKAGGRAFTAAQILQQAGFQNVKVMNGGMKAYKKLL